MVSPASLLRGLLALLPVLLLLPCCDAATSADLTNIIADLQEILKQSGSVNSVKQQQDTRGWWSYTTTPRPPPQSAECGSTTSVGTYFSSPGYPSLDSRDRACVLTVRPPNNRCGVRVRVLDGVFTDRLCNEGSLLLTGPGALYGGSDPFCWNITGYSFTVPLATRADPGEITIVVNYRAPFRFLMDVDILDCDGVSIRQLRESSCRRTSVFRSTGKYGSRPQQNAIPSQRTKHEYIRFGRSRKFEDSSAIGWGEWLNQPFQYISDLSTVFGKVLYNGDTTYQISTQRSNNGDAVPARNNSNSSTSRNARTNAEGLILLKQFDDMRVKHEKEARIHDFGTKLERTSQYFSDLVDVLVNILLSVKDPQATAAPPTSATTARPIPTRPIPTRPPPRPTQPTAATPHERGEGFDDLNEVLVSPNIILEDPFDDLSVELPIATQSLYPWAVSVERLNTGDDDGAVFCAGSLVSDDLVMTSASCLWDVLLTDVSVTVTETYSNGQTFRRKVGVMEIRYHYAYRDLRYARNLALLKLDETLTFSDNIRPVCLPTEGTTPPSAGSGGRQAGFDFLGVFRAVPLNILARQICLERFVSVEPNADIICAEPEIENVPQFQCPVEQGGGLVNAPSPAGVLWGVLSSGSICNFEPSFVLYTDVVGNLDWIDLNLQ